MRLYRPCGLCIRRGVEDDSWSSIHSVTTIISVGYMYASNNKIEKRFLCFQRQQVASSPYGVQRNTGNQWHEITDSAKFHPGYSYHSQDIPLVMVILISLFYTICQCLSSKRGGLIMTIYQDFRIDGWSFANKPRSRTANDSVLIHAQSTLQ